MPQPAFAAAAMGAVAAQVFAHDRRLTVKLVDRPAVKPAAAAAAAAVVGIDGQYAVVGIDCEYTVRSMVPPAR